ncbi:Clavaminate synthase-like protein [Trametopsis cervina]|nr:Clavaminate synthase-like protein [Trametopsis cervina]
MFACKGLIVRKLVHTQSLRLWPRTRSWASGSLPSQESIRYNEHNFPFRWLRDSCQCPQCVHPSTQQKLHRTSDISPAARPLPGGVRVSEDGIRIAWAPKHESFYSKDFLSRYSSPSARHHSHLEVDPIPWNVQSVQKSPSLSISYESLQQPLGLLRAMTQLTQYGLLFVTGVPHQETSTETAELRTLAEMFGQLRETFYGKLWDVINVRNSTNIAYTNLNLDLHMDLLYFQNPPRYQLLHCLRNRVKGGTSVFVDAFDAANRLRAADPSAFQLLATTPVYFHYINDGHHLHEAHPTIELDYHADTGPSGELPVKFINYSPPFQAPLDPSTPPEFYSALKSFVSLLEEPKARYEYLLREGDSVVFDNRRVLHARTAFTDQEHDKKTASGEPNRWLKGCYIEGDALLDRGRMLRKSVG